VCILAFSWVVTVGLFAAEEVTGAGQEFDQAPCSAAGESSPLGAELLASNSKTGQTDGQPGTASKASGDENEGSGGVVLRAGKEPPKGGDQRRENRGLGDEGAELSERGKRVLGVKPPLLF
jgi:hypothetical protein